MESLHDSHAAAWICLLRNDTQLQPIDKINLSYMVSSVYDARCHGHLDLSAKFLISAIFLKSWLRCMVEPLNSFLFARRHRAPPISRFSASRCIIIASLSLPHKPLLSFPPSSLPPQVQLSLMMLTPRISAARFTNAAPPTLNRSAHVLHFNSNSAASAVPPRASMYRLILSSFAAEIRFVPMKVAMARAHFVSCLRDRG